MFRQPGSRFRLFAASMLAIFCFPCADSGAVRAAASSSSAAAVHPAGGTARITAIRIEAGNDSTTLVIGLSSPVPFNVAAKADPDRVELDFPALSWSGSVAASGIGDGLIAVYRQGTPLQGGSRIVLETTVPVRVASAGTGLAARGQPTEFRLTLVSLDGSPPPSSEPSALAASAPAMPPLRQERFLPPPPPARTQAALVPPPVMSPAAVPQPLAVSLRSPGRPVPPAQQNAARPVEKARHVVAIDPGHGGIDPGTASPDGVFEKAITLQSGLALKAALEASGRYTVVLTRGEDRFVPLADRVKIARAAGAELFISLHCDAMEGREAHGATVYSLSETSSDAVSDRLAQQENRSAAIGGVDLSQADDGIASTLINLSMRQSLNQSNRFAELLVGEFGENHIRLQELKPHRSAGFAVLKAADMPSVLIEMGYLSDPEDAEQLGNPRHQRAVAAAITAGVDRYFRNAGRS